MCGVDHTLKKYIYSNYKGISTKISSYPTSFLENGQKLGSIYTNCTKRNIFCTLTDTLSRKVKSSCSLRVPNYKNEFNERGVQKNRDFEVFFLMKRAN